MPRAKEFDRDQALRRAAEVFWDHGFEGTSTDDLLQAMGIGRQSMYNAFGDKRRLYLEALQHYQAESGAELFERLRAASSPLSALTGVLLAVARQSAEDRARGCMAVNAATEFGEADPEVGAVVNSGVMLCHAAFERVLAEARRPGRARGGPLPARHARRPARQRPLRRGTRGAPRHRDRGHRRPAVLID
jgi:TetR/AcrR family transcriptional regulator, transcriptional repressor for nem operon